MNFKPTTEQEAAVEAFVGEDSLKINAYAGAGKTATLRLMADATPRRGIYIAFNRAIADEAKRAFPTNVNAVTSHSLAFRSVISRGFSKDQMLGKLNTRAIAQALNLSPLDYGDQKRITAGNYAFLVSETIKAFAYSDAVSISPDLVPITGSLLMLPKKDRTALQEVVSGTATDLWRRMEDPSNERFPLGHDGYFKVWSLSKPQLNAEYALLDEAQDSNPALLSVLRDQSSQVVLVGDRFQQIYGWRGAVNAMESMPAKNTLLLSQSFRFGPKIADFASKVIQLIDPLATVHGSPTIDSVIGCANPDAILSRTNSSLIGYVMSALEAGRLPYIVGGIAELKWMLEDVTSLKSGRPGSHPEFFGFRNWRDVLEFIEQPEGDALVTFVSIVEKYGEKNIHAALQRTATDVIDSDLVLSTAHKAKGLEWRSVMLADDFSEPLEVTKDNTDRLRGKGYHFVKRPDGKTYAIGPEEIRLLYVAATRGKEKVHLPEWCPRFFGVSQSTTPLRFEPPEPTELPTEERTPKTKATAPKNNDSGQWIWWVLGAIIVLIIFNS